MEEMNKSLTITFQPELAIDLCEIAKIEEVSVDEIVHELVLEALEMRMAIAEAIDECGEDANFEEILLKAFELKEKEEDNEETE